MCGCCRDPMISGFCRTRIFFVYSLLACDLSRSWWDYVRSVSCPLTARWRPVASSPLPSVQSCFKKMWLAPRKLKQKRSEREKIKGRNKQTSVVIAKEKRARPSTPPADAMKSGVGRNSGSSPPGARLLSLRPLLLLPLPDLRLRHLAHQHRRSGGPCPVQILPGAAMPRHQLVVPRS